MWAAFASGTSRSYDPHVLTEEDEAALTDEVAVTDEAELANTDD